jgi:hypothetical protein
MKTIFTIILLAFIGLNNTKAATFSSVSSGTWSTPATWTIIAGTDADGIPDSNDDVIINVGHTINLTSATNVLNFTNNGSLGGNNRSFSIFGNFTNSGSFPTKFLLNIKGACVFSSTNLFSAASAWYINANLTISAGTTISSNGTMNLYTNRILTNFGNVIISSNLAIAGTGKWINETNSSLFLAGNVSGSGLLIASALNNQVTYRFNTNTLIKSATYYNLNILAATPTRTATGNIIVLNDFTLGAGTANLLNLNNFNLTVGGNWSNLGSSTIINQGIVTFNGGGAQTISRTTGNEVITNLVKTGIGTLTLNKALTINQNLSINGGVLDLSASSFSIDIKGNFANNAAINSQQGLISFSGLVAQTISGTATTAFYNVSSSNVAGVSITSASTITNILTVSAGSFGTSGAGTIRIPATGATTYGRIGTIGGSLTGSGWTIESFIQGPAPQGWQWLSSPIDGNTLADWDNDARFYMSGVEGNDGNAAGFKSVRKYNEVTGAYVNITTTSEALTAGKGIMVWMADNNTTGLTAPLIYNSIGTPNFGNKSIAVSAGGGGSGYNLVGNPYACPINYSIVVAASGNLFPNFLILLENGSYSTNPNGGIIAPNQGFFCIANSTGNIQFTEASKNTIINPNILKNSSQNNTVTFNVYNNINGLGGQTSIEFSESSADVWESNKDLSYLASPYEAADNIWTISSDNKYLLWNSLNNNDIKKDVPLTVKTGVYGIHTISVKGLSSLYNYNSVILEDIDSGKKVDLVKEQNYNFDATEIGKEHHFIVHFSKNNQSDLKQIRTIMESALKNNTNIYNTPSNIVVKFDMQEETPVQISVYNLSGQQVIQPINLNVTNDRIALPLQKENGLYLIMIKSKDEQIVRKIIY